MRADARTWLARGLLVLGLIPLCFIAMLAVRSCTLERATRYAGPAGPRHLRRALATRAHAAKTGQVGHLEIARLDLRAPIVEGIDPDNLLVGVGHVPGTAYPGEPDNSALAGHRDTHLAALRRIRKGDRIRIETPDGVFFYDVDSFFVVKPDRGDLLASTGRARLTLVTCYPFHWIGPAPKRFIVRAQEVHPPEAPAGDATAASAPEVSGAGGAR
jgi:LPXTG-site transpeptidase (sortase) family protein